MNWYKLAARRTPPTAAGVQSLFPEMAAKIQKLYDEWDQSDEEMGDPELGFGGICQDFAEIMADVCNSHGINARTVSQTVGEQHVYAVLQLADGVYILDIPPQYYESGGGYNWQKIPDVTFDPSFFLLDQIDPDPRKFEEYTEEY